MKNKTVVRAIILLILGIIYATPGIIAFVQQWEAEPIVTGPGVTKKAMLSDYFEGLKGTPGDTEVYFLEGKEPGGTILLLGGTHPVEPATLLTAVTFVENAQVEKGRLIVIPRANASGYTATEPGQGYPGRFEIETDFGTRWFRFGMRNTNPIHQWPDPDVFAHPYSGQSLAGAESGNLNRNHPGRPNGRLTEKITYGIYQLIMREEPDISIDLHEAPPCRPLVNAMCVHEDAMDLAAYAVMLMELEGINIRLELSPENLRGLSHREWGNATNTKAILIESTSPLHGPLHGPATTDLILTAKDDVYVWASKLGRTVQEHTEEGVPISVRVGRHVSAVTALAEALGDLEPENSIIIKNVPSYQQIVSNGVGHYLKPAI